jgi:DNA-binding GntR family transcriptional regulator
LKTTSSPNASLLKRTGETSEELFQKLFEAILNGELKPGATLRQAKLAREWNVSRTPMREAVRRAAEEGYLILRNNNTPVVRRLTGEDVAGLYDLRETLEIHALERAFSHIDHEALQELREVAAKARPGGQDWEKYCLEFDLKLHGCWTSRCGNKWLESDLNRQFQFLQIFQRWIGHNTEVLGHTYKQHVGILAALEKGNARLTQKRLSEHIQDSMKYVSQTLKVR